MSAPIPVNASHPGVDNSWCLIDEIVAAEKRPTQQPRRLEKYAPVVKANYVNFSFAFLPCHKVLPYEQAVVSVFQVPIFISFLMVHPFTFIVLFWGFFSYFLKYVLMSKTC